MLSKNNEYVIKCDDTMKSGKHSMLIEDLLHNGKRINTFFSSSERFFLPQFARMPHKMSFIEKNVPQACDTTDIAFVMYALS